VNVARRVYFYGVAFASLVMLAIGLSGLGGIILDRLAGGLPGAGQEVSRPLSELTQSVSLVLVGLPVWLLHWRLAQRAAEREPGEREAALRRLYLYAVLLTFALRWAFSTNELLQTALGALLGAELTFGRGPLGRALLVPLPWIAVSGALWAYHRHVAVADRRLVGEVSASATLRRWYVYGVAFAGLLVMLNGAAGAFRLAWESLAAVALGTAVLGDAAAAARAGGTTLVGLALWLAHWSGWAIQAGPDVAEQDVRSVLRPVYLFLALGVSVGFSLTALARMLYYGLARLLGVSAPGGEGGPLLLLLGGPLGTAVVYGTSWLYHRAALATQARAQPELPAQAGVRRLYVYLVSLIALGLLATGAGGLLWTLADAATSATRTLNRPDWWREQVSLYATLLAVGLPVWLAHWGPVASPGARRWVADEPRALARRLYLYLTLLVGVLTLLGSGAVAARQVLDLVLGEAATGGALTNLARSLAVAAVSGAVVFYHQRVLRADVEITRKESEVRRPAAAAIADRAPTAPSPVRPYGIVYRRNTAEGSEWFSTAGEAREALTRLNSGENGIEWATLVRIEEPPEERVPPD
jgi:Domain of unknown function (DUF5671)